MTLVETLVVMIISGVVFLSVFEGFSLFRKYALHVTEKVNRNIEFYDGYYKLESLITSADSVVAVENGTVEIYRAGNIHCRLNQSDSTILNTIGDFEDRLLMNAIIEFPAFSKNRMVLDSLNISVSGTGRQFSFGFTVNRPIQSAATEKIEQSEEGYGYE